MKKKKKKEKKDWSDSLMGALIYLPYVAFLLMIVFLVGTFLLENSANNAVGECLDSIGEELCIKNNCQYVGRPDRPYDSLTEFKIAVGPRKEKIEMEFLEEEIERCNKEEEKK